MFLSRAIPSAIRLISGFGIVLFPLWLFSFVFSCPRLSPEHRFPVVLLIAPVRSTSLNEKAASAAAHDFDEPVERQSTSPEERLSSGTVPRGLRPRRRKPVFAGSRGHRPRPRFHAVAYASAWIGS